ncbi:MAG: hypothetical protein IKU43_05305 [Clostridia bacterium]|nr:hypothetical protein [Clostridia bacterium]
MNNKIIRSGAEASAVKAEIDAKAEVLKKEIVESESNYSEVIGKIYYVSENGNDENDGLSENSPIKSLAKASELDLFPGDAVLFKRGDTFRGRLASKRGVIYSAYGEGKKPVITNSLMNFSDATLWEKTEVENVYKLTIPQENDVGIIVFDEGKAWTQKRIKGRPEFPEGGLQNLDCDLAMWHDVSVPTGETGYVYLRSDKGNPADRFSSIEVARRQNIIVATHDTTFDNLCIKYGAAHGIGSGTVNGLTVRYCEFGFIGGSWFRTDTLSRFGNAIEIYGGCRNFVCDHNYIYQIYDAGITQQLKHAKSDIVMTDIRYSNNLIEDTAYCIEYFLDPAPDEAFAQGEAKPVLYTKNFEVVGNIMRRSGYGFCEQRPDKQSAHIKGWKQNSPVINHTVHDNIFDTSLHLMLHVAAEQPEWMPKMSSNIYVSGTSEKNSLGDIGGRDADGSNRKSKRANFDDDFERVFNDVLGEKNSIFVLEK